MISNFNEVEKSLKRCLKEKVSITTATVVGFLIAGTVAFGTNYTNNNFVVDGKGSSNNGLEIKEESKLEGVVYEYKKTNGDTIQRLIKITKGTTLDEKTELSTGENLTLLDIVGEDPNNTTSVTNNGILINKATGGGRSVVGVNAFYGDTSFVNNGTITRGKGTAIDLSAGDGKTATLTNTGTITGMIKSDPNVAGNVVINLENKSDIDGEFIFWGKGKRTINIDNNKDELTITNLATNETFVKAGNKSEITLNGNIQSKGTTVEFDDSTLTNNVAIIGNIGISSKWSYRNKYKRWKHYSFWKGCYWSKSRWSINNFHK